MGMFSFIKEAGEKLFGRGEAKAAQEAAAATPTPENIAALSKAAGEAIATYINSMNLNVQALESPAWHPTRPPRRRCCCAAATWPRWPP
jgi:hypothetical protein